MAQIEIEYGPRWGPDTGKENAWAGKGTSLVTQDVYGKYAELVRRGLVFSASTALSGITLAATNVSPLPAGTGTPIVGVYVPPGSLFDVTILNVKIWNVSGTAAAGPFAWNALPNSNITATGARGFSHLNGAQSSDATVFVNAATTGSAAGVLLRGVGPANFAAAIAATSPLYYDEDINGSIWVAPGVGMALAAPGAGTTWVVGASMTWAELPRAAP